MLSSYYFYVKAILLLSPFRIPASKICILSSIFKKDCFNIHPIISHFSLNFLKTNITGTSPLTISINPYSFIYPFTYPKQPKQTQKTQQPTKPKINPANLHNTF